MTESNAYGSRPEYLPDFMNDARDEDGRQVVRLDRAESRELEAVTLNRFPAASGDVLDFDAASYDDRLWWDDEEHWARMAAELLSPYVRSEERVAVLWGNLVMPTVTMPAGVAVRHARDILDAGPHFWIHPLGSSVLIECLMDGQVTVATIPSA
ncbi:hypothetical protein HHL19_30330 [Streptomyces sp. R302]|uniref:hypothetical protein n=1 Tax=unclassified Streptomyces TaxID=2593676 RepID=UPI00145CB602|nr:MULTISPECIES: hypothetical protein [unclassified Streptomyces]NML53157.1 hypothetical protein [Streptomyces sp. R301]NML82840.1 hypothetical protein [Streptomyces sp. R302]